MQHQRAAIEARRAFRTGGIRNCWRSELGAQSGRENQPACAYTCYVITSKVFVWPCIFQLCIPVVHFLSTFCNMILHGSCRLIRCAVFLQCVCSIPRMCFLYGRVMFAFFKPSSRCQDPHAAIVVCNVSRQTQCAHSNS